MEYEGSPEAILRITYKERKQHMKKILIAALMSVSMVLVGCGGDPCTATPVKNCSADPEPVKPTDASIKACQDAAKTPPKCKTELDAVASCTKGIKITCTADNKTDGAKYAADIAATCKTQNEAYATCFAKP
jgi:hypothetical protein